MAENDVATKAPESDAQEPSILSSGDTPAQTGPTMGEHCVTDRPSPTDGQEPSGELTKIADVDVYIAKPADYPHLPSKLLLFLSSGTGIHSRNNQLQADKYASEGFLVVMPDQFAGDHAPNTPSTPTSVPPSSDTPPPSMIDKVKLGFASTVATTAKSFMLDMWLARQTPEKVLPILHRVIAAARDEFADAVANGGGVYAVGYCFGGKYVCLLAHHTFPAAEKKKKKSKPRDEEQGVKGEEEEGEGPLIKCGALAHGTLVTREDVEGIRVPVSMVCVEQDPLFSDEVRVAGKEYLEKEGREFEMRVYEKVPHGFAVVGEYADEGIRVKQGEAFEQMVGWLKGH